VAQTPVPMKMIQSRFLEATYPKGKMMLSKWGYGQLPKDISYMVQYISELEDELEFERSHRAVMAELLKEGKGNGKEKSIRK